MIKSASPPFTSISKQHHQHQPAPPPTSTTSQSVDHEQHSSFTDQSRGSEAGSKMSNDQLGAAPTAEKVKTEAKRTSAELQPGPAATGDVSDVRATPSQRPSSKRSETLREDGQDDGLDSMGGRPKRTKSENGARALPLEYEHCPVSDLVQVICEMLMDLIRINDPLPLQDGGLTRFHSRVPPAISVLDYLHRLATHATLSPPILLSMVYYIDKLCALYPAFTISSLTVHRFLISSATVASKGLSDAFWTNGTYARVGGVSIRELALLELELLWRIDWRIVPQPEVLTDYYRSLIARSEGFKLEQPPPE